MKTKDKDKDKPKPNCHQTHNDQEWPEDFNFCPHCGERLVAGLPILFAREPERMLEKNPDYASPAPGNYRSTRQDNPLAIHNFKTGKGAE